MDSLISQLCLLSFPSLHLLPELLFSLHCHSVLLKESHILYLFIILSWSPHCNIQMVVKGGNFSLKILQNLSFISSQILYFVLFPRSEQSVLYPDSFLLLTFTKMYEPLGKRKSPYQPFEKGVQFPSLITDFLWSTHLAAKCNSDLF